jgi:hypothetical protein
MKKTTNIELVNELIKRNSSGKYHAIIERARENGYHDFKFDEDKYPDCTCPKIDLVNDLTEFSELSDIRKAVIDGEYDESPDEDDKKKMMEECPFFEKIFKN